MEKTEIISFYMDNGILVSPDLIAELDEMPLPLKTGFVILGKDSLNIITNHKNVVIEDFEKAIVLKEKHKDTRLYSKFMEYLKESSHDAVSQGIAKKTALASVNKEDSLKENISKEKISTQTIHKIPEPIIKHMTSKSEVSAGNMVLENGSNISTIKHDVTSSNTSSEEIFGPSINKIGDKGHNLDKNSDSIIVVDASNTSSIVDAGSLKHSDHDIGRDVISTNEALTTSDVFIPNLDADAANFKIKKVAIDPLLREEYFRNNKIRIVSSYNTKVRKWAVHDFVSLYNARYKELEKILRSRQELQSLTSISRISAKKERENVALIGVVYEKGLTKTGNIMLTLEDPTGMIKVVVTKAKEEAFRLAEEIQLDEIIGVAGMFDQIIFASSLLIPDIPLTKELKKSPDEGYFVVIADTEPGSKLFLEKEFDKFILWINGEVGNERQREVASKVKYVFVAGDLVNGVGIYPNQEFDLNILDIRDQYTAFANLLKRIPSHIPIFVCPGNHDVGRISEPQPAIDEEYAADMISMPNVISLSNPSIVNIFAQPENNFDGFDVMFYHGYSFIYYSENVPSIRKAGGQKRPDMIMKYLLQRRHLAPSHTSTLYIPDPKCDPLVIDKVPDFLLSGHVHRAMVSNYKNVTCINASCWTGQSEEQERRGLEAQPARAFIVDMHTREVKIMNFMPRDDEKEPEASNQASSQTSSEAKNG